jgi:hypothetical protein
MIVGDYFDRAYILELAVICKALSPGAEQTVVCTNAFREALAPFFDSNGVENVRFATVPESSPVLTQWARDVAVAGKRSGRQTLVVSPYKHAASAGEAEVVAGILERVFPERTIELAPFVFEAGNLAFVRSGRRSILVAGRKVLFDNAVYQKRPWAAGYDSDSLLAVMAETFDVDSVIVVGRAAGPPPTRVYFEYHIDMGMAILSNNRAVVAKLEFGEVDETELSRAVAEGKPVVSPFVAGGGDRAAVVNLLSRRLRTVSLEYADYARVLEDLGYDVHRLTVGWRQVVGSMSWTNILQTPGRIFMPIYPDSLRGRTTSVARKGGQLKLTVDKSDLSREQFDLTDLNAEAHRLYNGLGYDVVTVPEYLHYMMGGIHCFVNIVE